MDIETRGLGAGSYPTPPEEKPNYVNGKIYISYEFKEIEVPETWDREQILEDIKDNMAYYLEDSIEKIEEVEIDG